MIIRCIANTGADLPVSYIDRMPFGYPKEATQFDLTIGSEYRVYAIETERDRVGYYINNDSSWGYPLYAPSPLFEIVDTRPSRFWQVRVYSHEWSEVRWVFWARMLGKLKLSRLIPRTIHTSTCLSVGFLDWIHDPYYYDHLTDGEETARLAWEYYERLIDLEYPDSTVTETPDSCGDGWLFCNHCNDGWQPEGANSTLGVVICPKCRRRYHNPLLPPVAVAAAQD